MMNKAILIGRLTRDPEVRYTQAGEPVTSFTMAVDRPFTNTQGQREADFLPVVTFRKVAETCAKYLGKGRLVAVSGRIQTRNYQAQDGTKRYVTEIVGDEVRFLERAPEGAVARDLAPTAPRQNVGQSSNPGYDSSGYYPDEPSGGNSNSVPMSPMIDEDDDLPF